MLAIPPHCMPLAAPFVQAWACQIGVGSDAGDREAREVGGWGHLGRVEFDHPVVQSVTDSNDIADGSAVSGGHSDDRCAGPAAVPGGETDQLTGLVVADGRKGAVAAVDDNSSAATEQPWAIRHGDAGG